MSMIEEEFRRKAAQLVALKSIARREPRPEGVEKTDIIELVVDKVQREVGSSPGLGRVPINNKLALAARYLAQDYGIIIDTGSIAIERTKDQDDFQLLRILVSRGIGEQLDPSPPSSSSSQPKGPDPAEVKALRMVSGKDADDIADIIGSPSDTANTMESCQMSLDELVEGDAAKVREILVRAGLLKSSAPSQPVPMSPEEISLIFHQKASRSSNGEGRLNDAALHLSLAKCVVNYSYGPNPKYRYSVKLNKNGTLEVIVPKSTLNARFDIGPGTQNENRSMELNLGMALLEMSTLIEAEFRKGRENPNALALYQLFRTISGLVMEQCNQENAKDLVPIVNRIKP